VLKRALREVLSLRDVLQFGAALDERARNTPCAKLHGGCYADRTTAHNEDLIPTAEENDSGGIPESLKV
jgi:hypothetical protein